MAAVAGCPSYWICLRSKPPLIIARLSFWAFSSSVDFKILFDSTWGLSAFLTVAEVLRGLTSVSGYAWSWISSGSRSALLVSVGASSFSNCCAAGWLRFSFFSGSTLFSSRLETCSILLSRFDFPSGRFSSARAVPEAKNASPTMTEATPTVSFRMLKVCPFSKRYRFIIYS